MEWFRARLAVSPYLQAWLGFTFNRETREWHQSSLLSEEDHFPKMPNYFFNFQCPIQAKRNPGNSADLGSPVHVLISLSDN